MSYIKENISEIESNKNIIPKYCLSFSEMSKYLEEQNKTSISDLLETISESEINYFKENHAPKVYTESDIEDVRSRVYNHFRDRWAGYEGFWECVIDKFDNLLTKFEPLTEKDLYSIAKDKSFGKIHEFVDLDSVNYAESAMDLYNGAMDILSENQKLIVSKDFKLKVVHTPIVEATSRYIIENMNLINESTSRQLFITDSNLVAKAIKEFSIKESTVMGIMFNEANTLKESTINSLTEWLPYTDNILSNMHECYAKTLDDMYHNVMEMALVKSKAIISTENSDWIDIDLI